MEIQIRTLWSIKQIRKRKRGKEDKKKRKRDAGEERREGERRFKKDFTRGIL